MHRNRFSQALLIELFTVFQGLSFGVVPALGFLFTGEDFHNLSSAEYQTLFTPFLVASVVYASIAGWISHKWKIYWVFITGITMTLLGLLLISLTSLTLSFHHLTFGMLYVALFCIGGGVGLNMMVLSRWMPAIFSNRPISSLLILWAGASFGLTFSGVFVQYSLALHMWWLAPGLIFGALFVLLILIDFFDHYPEFNPEQGQKIEIGMILFSLCAILYGFVEAVMGLWMATRFDLNLIAFWAVATGARIALALILPIISAKVWYFLLPIGLTVSLLYLPQLYYFLAFCVTPLIVLNISLAQEKYKSHRSLITGISLACYLLGIGLGGIFRTAHKSIELLLILGIVLFVFHVLTLFIYPNRTQKDRKNNESSS